MSADRCQKVGTALAVALALAAFGFAGDPPPSGGAAPKERTAAQQEQRAWDGDDSKPPVLGRILRAGTAERRRAQFGVILHEGINARYLDPVLIGEQVDLAVCDVSFISATLILPAMDSILRQLKDNEYTIK